MLISQYFCHLGLRPAQKLITFVFSYRRYIFSLKVTVDGIKSTKSHLSWLREYKWECEAVTLKYLDSLSERQTKFGEIITGWKTNEKNIYAGCNYYRINKCMYRSTFISFYFCNTWNTYICILAVWLTLYGLNTIKYNSCTFQVSSHNPGNCDETVLHKE